MNDAREASLEAPRNTRKRWRGIVIGTFVGISAQQPR
jgi:hypothetical protein